MEMKKPIKSSKKRGLGRDLNSLLGGLNAEAVATTSDGFDVAPSNNVNDLSEKNELCRL